MAKKALEQSEMEETEFVIAENTPDGTAVDVNKLEGVMNYFPTLDQTVQRYDVYDAILYVIAENPRYYLGTAAARARDALVLGGKFYIDCHGFVGSIEEIVAIVEMMGLSHVKTEDTTVLVFTKESSEE